MLTSVKTLTATVTAANKQKKREANVLVADVQAWHFRVQVCAGDDLDSLMNLLGSFSMHVHVDKAWEHSFIHFMPLCVGERLHERFVLSQLRNLARGSFRCFVSLWSQNRLTVLAAKSPTTPCMPSFMLHRPVFIHQVIVLRFVVRPRVWRGDIYDITMRARTEGH